MMMMMMMMMMMDGLAYDLEIKFEFLHKLLTSSYPDAAMANTCFVRTPSYVFLSLHDCLGTLDRKFYYIQAHSSRVD